MSKPYGKPDRIVVALGGNALGNNPVEPVSYTHLTLPTIRRRCRSRWSPYH